MRSDEVLLRDLNARLDLPPRARVQVLREVRDDLEAMVDLLVEQGVSRRVAEQRALALLRPGDEAIEELAAVHLSPFGQLAARLGHVTASNIERAAVIALAGLAAVAPLPALILGGPQPAWATLPLLMLAGVMAALLTRETLRWWARGEQDVRALAHAAGVQAAAVGLTLAWGGLVAVMDAYVAAGTWEMIPPSPQMLAAWASRLTTLLALSLGVAMLGVFGSLALMQALWQARNLETELTELLHSSHFNR